MVAFSMVIGRMLQWFALILLPIAVIMEISGQLGRRGVSEMLIMMVVGACAFGLGRVLEGYGRASQD